MATKEFLRKMREKYGLGEYRKGKAVKIKRKSSNKAVKQVKIKRRRIYMARRGRKSFSRKGSGLGGSSLIKSALIGIGGAHLAGYIPVDVPYKEEVVGAAAAYLMNKNIKSAAIGAAAVFATKAMQNKIGGSTGGITFY